MQLNGLHPTALFVITRGGELCGILVLLRHVSFKQVLFIRNQGGQKEGCASHHRTQIKRDASVFLLSFLQCPFIVVLGRCACMYLQILPNALPPWSLCILLNTCSDKQGTPSMCLMPTSSSIITHFRSSSQMHFPVSSFLTYSID